MTRNIVDTIHSNICVTGGGWIYVHIILYKWIHGVYAVFTQCVLGIFDRGESFNTIKKLDCIFLEGRIDFRLND